MNCAEAGNDEENDVENDDIDEQNDNLNNHQLNEKWTYLGCLQHQTTLTDRPPESDLNQLNKRQRQSFILVTSKW